MLAEERFKLPNWTIEIHGTDISEDVLTKARAGVFGPQTMEDVPDKQKTRYFTQLAESGDWEARAALKSIISISRHNLMEPFRERNFDCIFIRNVLIYFDRESKQVVIDSLVRSMSDGGYLVVGPSEGIFDMLGMLQKRSTFLYQKV